MMTSSAITTPDTRVQLFHASLLWPLQIEPSPSGAARTQHWEVLNAIEDTHAWRRIDDEFTDDPGMFRERHYREFVSFLPYVQRFLYGDSRAGRFADTKGRCDSPMHVFRRKDIATLRLTLREGQAPVELDVVHMDLYFFDDLDLVQFNVEVSAKNISLDTARDILFRFGRAYPSGWDDDGQGLHNVHVAQWIGVDGQVVAQSDSTTARNS